MFINKACYTAFDYFLQTIMFLFYSCQQANEHVDTMWLKQMFTSHRCGR